jgi:leader peptidase (prepilin peptidase)/N-methyltransferase
MSWKHKAILFIVALLGIVGIYFTGLTHIVMIKSILLYLVLTMASYLDHRFRIIPDWVHLVIIAIGFININLARSLFGLVISPLPFLIMALINKGSIGGGDIKLIGSTGFALGYVETTTAYLTAMALAILFYGLYYFGKKKIRDQSFPFAPFFLIGYVIVVISIGF